MNSLRIPQVRKQIRNSSDPVHTARQILLEKYSSTKGVSETDVQKGLSFELFRSIVIEQIHLAVGLSNGYSIKDLDLELEIADAKKANRDSSYPKPNFNEFWINHMGSYREYIPGLGYGVSIRKRRSHNQDSFLLMRRGRKKTFMVCDGLGSMRNSAIASNYAKLKTKQLFDGGISLDKAQIKDIGLRISERLGSDKSISNPKKWGGATTLLNVTTELFHNHIIRVGDSSAFSSALFGGYSENGLHYPYIYLVNAVGQPTPFLPIDGFIDGIEEYVVTRGRVLIFSDGVTTALKDYQQVINRISQTTSDPLIFAERLVRVVLLAEIQSGYDDDVTIVIEDRDEGIFNKLISAVGLF